MIKAQLNCVGDLDRIDVSKFDEKTITGQIMDSKMLNIGEDGKHIASRGFGALF